ncbi:hypothetical protein [Cupriavidus ulmosensis]
MDPKSIMDTEAPKSLPSTGDYSAPYVIDRAGGNPTEAGFQPEAMSHIPNHGQQLLDRFYAEHGPCCAGCDWWQRTNSLVGECRKSAPVSGADRFAMLGIRVTSLTPDAGHIMTPREHHCGEFKDEFDWDSLPFAYLRKIGHKAAKP